MPFRYTITEQVCCYVQFVRMAFTLYIIDHTWPDMVVYGTDMGGLGTESLIGF